MLALDRGNYGGAPTTGPERGPVRDAKRIAYLQGLASTEQPQPAPDCSHFTDLLAAREKRAQSLPYSKSTKLAQDSIAARSADRRLGALALLP
jgi:hypothetical protein